eukprot:3704415-Pyramimonas_sp.AAC.1
MDTFVRNPQTHKTQWLLASLSFGVTTITLAKDSIIRRPESRKAGGTKEGEFLLGQYSRTNTHRLHLG